MAPRGEERLLTLFGDIHYYFGEPSPHPVHHRFDKESYVYLYRDAAQKRGRLEIANHAGTPEQDAFTGYLDRSRIVQSNRHPTLVTITVDGFGRTSPSSQASEHHWRLPSTDPRDEGNYLFRLHTLDIYFWTVEDVHNFLRHARETLHPQQLSIDVPPTPPPATAAAVAAAAATTPQGAPSMSPIVQNLEKVAISGENRSASTTAQVGSIAPTPTAGQPASAAQAAGQQQQQEAPSFAPLAYNPASPPAPEEIKHREKTPPPADAADGGTGLATAAYADNLHAAGQLPPPPPGGPRGSVSSPQPQHRLSNAQQKYVPQNIDLLKTQHSPPPASNQPLDTPTAEILGVSPGGHRQPVAHLQPQYMDYLSSRPPTGSPAGSQHHSQHQSHHQPLSPTSPQPTGGPGDWAIHQQVYVPGEGEAHGWGGEKVGKGRKGSAVGAGQGGDAGPGRLEQRAERVEKGFNKFLRKVEKKVG